MGLAFTVTVVSTYVPVLVEQISGPVLVGVLGLLGARSLWGIGLALAVLYAGYYAVLAPYWSLYPDLVPAEQSGRSRSAESTWRVVGVGLALVAGGLLRDRRIGPCRGRPGHHAAGPRPAGEQGVRGHVVHVLGCAARQPAVPAGAPWRPSALMPLPTQW